MKRIIALLAVLMSLAVFFTGCSSQSASKKQAGAPQQTSQATSAVVVEENGTYTDKDRVALYIHKFGKLPKNYITKNEAKHLGWKEEGTLDKVAPGKSIGGDHFGNFEHQVPDKKGRHWKECDIDYVKGNRGPKRIVFSDDGLVYYSGSHYRDFVKLY